ncbi:sulfurtransferase complex subunit TusB [Shewanella sp. AS1]|uniref:sulfurtransferase complex subunit TusB n=1 Tax=Shewanella sp. AS1 TaxID=2907626 RepID=UPI001F359A4F|nr:sulfurtransferase complex subunit TusB [Shewanella sp. AS1]MCE9678482.1 sulfurtransferase complex subunit TusB [Shewanella sp. AS1]
MILHTLQENADYEAALRCCLRYIAPQDTLLLYGDAINLLLQTHWQNQLAQTQVLLLKDAVKARGLTDYLHSYKQITSAEFVEQTLLHSKVISW